MMKKCLCITIVLVLLIGIVPVSAKTKSEKINDYLETSFDVYNVPIVEDIYTFKEMALDGTINPCIEDDLASVVPYTISVKKNGCLVIYRAESSHIYIKDVKKKNEQDICYFERLYSSGPDIKLLPLRKGDKISISKLANSGKIKLFIGFIPEEKIFCIDESIKNTNGTLCFTFGNIFGNGTNFSISAVKKKYSSTEIMSQDIFNYNPTITYNYTSIMDGDSATLILPESGEYTVKVKVSMNNLILSYATFILDTDKYINPTLDELEEPISAVSGTNIIVGYGEPSAIVYIEYDSKKYEGTVNRNGIYKIKLKTDMKEGKQFKIWQTKNKLSSKKAKYRVTDVD